MEVKDQKNEIRRQLNGRELQLPFSVLSTTPRPCFVARSVLLLTAFSLPTTVSSAQLGAKHSTRLADALSPNWHPSQETDHLMSQLRSSSWL